MASETSLFPLKPTLQLPSKRNSHETNSRRRPTNLLCLASLCLVSLITSLGDITHLTSTALTSIEESSPIPPIIYTTLPTTIGTILAAAFLPPLTQLTQPPTQLTQSTKQHSPFPELRLALPALLALTTLASTILRILATAPLHTLTLQNPPQNITFITTVMAHLLQGFAGGCSLALAMVLSGGGAQLRAVCACGALGAVFRAVAGGMDGVCEVDGGGKLAGWAGWWLLVGEVVLAFTAAGGLVLPGCVRWGGEEEGGDEGGGVRPEIGLPVAGGGGGYPPPASRATIFGALFAFAYYAAAAAIPGGLDLLVSYGRSYTIEQSLTVFTTASLWAGIAVGRFVALPWDGLIRPKQGVRRAVLAAGGFLIVFWLSPNPSRNTAVAAGLVGAVLGPVYPCVVGTVMRELGQDEMLSAIGIIVAFGHSGMVTALLTTQLAAYVDAPVVLYLVIVTLFGCMLVCWEALTEKGDGGVVSDFRDDVW
ncbi:uncharacterized protein B0H64DRAFT_183070 [Chaetomium fimeti]|uniref:Major facilitator superfamily (MFS) profile domain-containing protein n=1 Tax=Chaetomium fimeti TaxID=1854472 RepID=A0AAE0LR60_9PEZI|nr:hypothetical protein B0H64DRAFT_183070 [Chaetomium fimeti]